MKFFWTIVMALSVALTAASFAADEAEIAIVRADKSKVPLTVELALDDKAHEQGLMYRTELAPNHGMLFIYDRAMPRYFWMKNTLIPLDIVFFDRKGKIIYVVDKAKPKSLDIVGPKGQDVCTVLEIGGGEAKRLKLALGDQLVFKKSPDCK